MVRARTVLGLVIEDQRTRKMRLPIDQSISMTHALLLLVEEGSDAVLETRVLVSRRFEDKNESLGLGS